METCTTVFLIGLFSFAAAWFAVLFTNTRSDGFEVTRAKFQEMHNSRLTVVKYSNLQAWRFLLCASFSIAAVALLAMLIYRHIYA